jgi:hypothetical protein
MPGASKWSSARALRESQRGVRQRRSDGAAAVAAGGRTQEPALRRKHLAEPPARRFLAVIGILLDRQGAGSTRRAAAPRVRRSFATAAVIATASSLSMPVEAAVGTRRRSGYARMPGGSRSASPPAARSPRRGHARDGGRYRPAARCRCHAASTTRPPRVGRPAARSPPRRRMRRRRPRRSAGPVLLIVGRRGARPKSADHAHGHDIPRQTRQSSLIERE